MNRMIKFFYLIALLACFSMPAAAQVAEEEPAKVTEMMLDSEEPMPVPENGNTGMAKVTASSLAQYDLNGDNVLNAIDMVDLIRYLNGKTGSAFQLKKADINADKLVDYEDVKAIAILLTGGELEEVSASDSTTPTSGSSFTLRGDTVSDPTFK